MQNDCSGEDLENAAVTWLRWINWWIDTNWPLPLLEGWQSGAKQKSPSPRLQFHPTPKCRLRASMRSRTQAMKIMDSFGAGSFTEYYAMDFRRCGIDGHDGRDILPLLKAKQRCGR
jgi:hypothetical protein